MFILCDRRSRRVHSTVVTQLSVNPHAVSPTFDADHKAPVVENPVPLVDARRSQAWMQSILLHLLPVTEDRLPHVLGLVVIVLGLGVFLVKIVQRQVAGWQPRRRWDEERISSLATVCTTLATRHATASCHKPARNWYTSRSRSCARQRPHNMGHLNGLVGVLLGHVQRNSGNAPLCRPG